MGNETGGKHILLLGPNGVSGAVTFTTSTNKVALAAHGLLNGDRVKFNTIVTTTTIVDTVTYYVVNTAAGDFEVALTKGGATVAIDATGTGVLEDTQQIFGGLRSKSIGINNEEIDVTNHDSDEWKTLLDTAGIRSASVSGSGVLVEADTVLKNIRAKMILGTIVPLTIILDTRNSAQLAGSFKITEFSAEGEYNAEGSFSISASSSGPVVYTPGI